jgi:hypothetical protein
MLFSLGAWQSQATVGGPTYIYDFKYNPLDESVYYTSQSDNGRGCPPILAKISLVTGKSEIVFSCDDGEKLSSTSLVNYEINKITNDLKLLTPLNLRENDITIDIKFLNSEYFNSEGDWLKNHNFFTSVYQGNKKVTDFTITGCNIEQPFIFSGYAVPGFDKKIILLSSAVNDCWEGGYIFEKLYVVDGVDNLNKEYESNSYKGSSALVPNKGSLIIFESDKINENRETSNNENVNTSDDLKEKPENQSSILVLIVISLSSILIGVSISKLFVKKRPLD